MAEQTKSVAVFIDAENISYEYAKEIFKSASTYGDIIIKRIYADWSDERLVKWKNEIFNYSIIAMQQFSGGSGKNSSDMYLVTEALSIFYEKQIDVFIIVSSDRDYTSLVQKIRESKKKVVGMGVNKASKSYINAFNEFIYLDKNNQTLSEEDKFQVIPKEQIEHLKTVIDNLIDDKGIAILSTINNNMRSSYSDFSAKNYNFSGFKNLISEFIKIDKQYKLKVQKDNITYYLTKSEKNLNP